MEKKRVDIESYLNYIKYLSDSIEVSFSSIEKIRKKSGTMRLGAFDCELVKDSLAQELYKKKLISERHRHRYEFNSAYQTQLEEGGLIISGKNPETGLIEMVELDRKQHPFFIGTQAHPEFKSRLMSAAPLFTGLIVAAIQHTKMVEENEFHQ
jgi:CTP synthase